MGEAPGGAGVSVEGGGTFVVDGIGVARFLFADDQAELATATLRRAGIGVVTTRDVLVQCRMAPPVGMR